MPRYQGARLSSELAGRKVHVICERCGLSRRYDGDAILARIGPDVPLPDLLTRIALGNGCTLNAAPTPNGIRCALRYGEASRGGAVS